MILALALRRYALSLREYHFFGSDVSAYETNLSRG